jgi:exopolysaccharide biosynthesis polyprenyl glycosylphosphotransferase
VKEKLSKIEIYLPLTIILLDILAIFAAYVFSYYLRFHSPFTDVFSSEKGIPGFRGYIYFALMTLPIWILTFQTNKLYKLRRTVFIGDEFVQVVKGVSISILLSIGIIFFFREFPYSRVVFVLIWLTAIIFITIERYIALKIEKTFYNRNIGLRNAAIAGTNEMADKIYRTLVKDRFTGLNLIGFFSQSEPDIRFSEGKNFLGNISQIQEKIKELKIEKLIISIDKNEVNRMYNIIKSCEGINVEFMLVPDFTEVIISKLKIREIDGIPFMILKSMPLSVWDRILKRLFDIFASLFILIAISPVFTVLALLVKFTSKGPLFYRQERVSLDGVKFDMLKFRSMRVDAEADGVPRFASKDDDRYTSIGLFIRKYSLDELPQFLNVLKGDMSIVGPRPEREYFINIMKQEVNKYLERHRVKSGITGWAQVNGLRGAETSMEARTEYDIYYIENWSLVFDIKIIFKTIKEMFFSKSAF